MRKSKPKPSKAGRPRRGQPWIWKHGTSVVKIDRATYDTVWFRWRSDPHAELCVMEVPEFMRAFERLSRAGSSRGREGFKVSPIKRVVGALNPVK